MNITLDELMDWDKKAREWSDKFGLTYYTQEFEICDHEDMLGYMAYSGMPSRYAHWSFGKSFEVQKTLYDHGVGGLPYEMVINSDPCLAYLMRDNSPLLQILTICHVYGHNDFFKNNFTFTSGTHAAYTIEMFKSHHRRIAKYIEDPSIGLEAVESTIDHAHSVSLQCNRNLAIKKLSLQEQRQRAWEKSQPTKDRWHEIHPEQKFISPDFSRIPHDPDEDILDFISDNNPLLPNWKRDIIKIVATESKYFVPQIETKIMNEGWASYWHYRILKALGLPHGHMIEFMVRHNQVLSPSPGGLNPYHLGFKIWEDIERRWNREAGLSDKDYEALTLTPEMTPGRKKVLEVRLGDRDSSFLRRFLTEDLIRELHLFQHEKRGNDRVVTKVADQESWETIKENLLSGVGMGSIPTIKVEDADWGRNRILYLKHYHDGRDLLLEYAERTIKHIRALWEREVVLETIINGKASILKLVGDSLKIEKK